MMQGGKRAIYCITTLFLQLATLNCREVSGEQPSSQSTQEQCLTPIVNSANEFGASLISNLGEENNFFISPFSIYAALAMTYLGARGQTAREIENAFHFANNNLESVQFHESFRNLMNYIVDENDEYSLFLANGMFLQQGFKIEDKYINDLTQFYHADIKTVDFANEQIAAKDEINQFVAENTRNKINEFLTEPLNPQTVLALINAIYFKGIWKIQFPREETIDLPFYKNDDTSETVKYMTLQNQHFRFFIDYANEYKFLELPYKGGDISMLLALPLDIDQPPNLNMNSEFLCQIHSQLNDVKMYYISLPKFQLKYKKELDGVLNQLGIQNLFSHSANLTGIREDGDIQVSTVIHEAVIDVNEEGSEATAVTGVSMTRLLPPNSFLANHPFLFYIIDKRNGLILFSGRLSDP